MHFPSLRKPQLFILLAALALAGTVTGDPPNRPTWWMDPATRVIPEGAVENNLGPANIGQAKHMADMALKALATKDQGLSNTIRQKLTTPQPNPADLSGPLLPKIIDFTPPSPLPTNWPESQRAPLLLGQLKAIAAPFYTHLDATNPTWLAAERTTNGTNYPGSIFPWTATTADDTNKATATVGQLKAVFSLRFETLPPTSADSDGDGLPDSWELLHFGDLAYQNALSDTDGDGLTDISELAANLSPFLMDTDGDGLLDSEDVNPLIRDYAETAIAGLVRILTPSRP